MKAVTIKQLKDELAHKSANELKELCLHLSRFKKENKELLTYLLFESGDEEAYIHSIKNLMDIHFLEINTKSFFYIRKSARKILTLTKKYIRYSKKKETETELLLYFCKKLKEMKPSMSRSTRLQNVFDSQIKMIKKAIEKLHEDLQYDYQLELNDLLDEE
jgi:vacuolar-type H+-ATPase catalytic subunit A/Vma1